YRPRNEPTSIVAPDERWHLARWLLRDETIDPRDRVAGLLVLLYGQPVSRIVPLPRSAVHFNEQSVCITLAAEPIELPEQLAHAVKQLYQTPVTTHRDV